MAGRTANPTIHRTNLDGTNRPSLKTFITGVAPARASVGAFAQAAAPVTAHVDRRETNPQGHIDKGVASGALTARETDRLDKPQARVTVADSAAKVDGKVTAKQRVHLQRTQNHGIGKSPR